MLNGPFTSTAIWSYTSPVRLFCNGLYLTLTNFGSSTLTSLSSTLISSLSYESNSLKGSSGYLLNFSGLVLKGSVYFSALNFFASSFVILYLSLLSVIYFLKKLFLVNLAYMHDSHTESWRFMS